MIINKMLDSALEYARHNMLVSPLWPKGKHPLSGFGFNEPTTDEQLITRWWTICPDANIGIPTGLRHNSLIVIDLDVTDNADGQKELKRICCEYSVSLPDTAVVQTGSGGVHLYFRNNKGVPVTGGKNMAPGIDIRSEGAHVVAPPSVHRNGRSYIWLRGNIDTIADADENLFRLLSILENKNR
jgi:hypothetical protein